MFQGKAKSKIKSLEVEKDDETVPNTCHEADENGCREIKNDSEAKLESAVLPGEDSVDGTSEIDEQPLKKQKSVICENLSFIEAKNGGLAIIPIVHLFTS